ncbi:hypothetical protein AUJ38_00895 [bacterium CG1_02_42_9]|nr:MAG: hypothetical protein AUJ38_00895 [bacterium CG1_02_42_9]
MNHNLSRESTQNIWRKPKVSPPSESEGIQDLVGMKERDFVAATARIAIIQNGNLKVSATVIDWG